MKNLILFFCFLVSYFLYPSNKLYAQCWKQVSAGLSHTIALQSDGTLWTWGNNNFGQLGKGTNSTQYTPTKIGLDEDWKMVAAGGSSSFAIKNDGTLWACGQGTNGQLGNGSNSNVNYFVQVGTSNDWKFVIAGSSHTMGIKNDGSLWAWGNNNFGQLGIGAANASNIPVQVGLSNWKTVASGGNHTIGIKADGTLWAWGWNAYGQLGNGTTTNSSFPIQIGISDNWSYIETGTTHSLGIKADGTLWAWGYNNYGQLGDGTTTTKTSPTMIGHDFSLLSAGNYHTIATKTDGTLWAWGRNDDGQLGDGSNINRISPTLIYTSLKCSVLACGGFFTIGMFITESIAGWGKNDLGQLGLGFTNPGNRNTATNIGVSCAPIALNPTFKVYPNIPYIGSSISIQGEDFTPSSTATLRIRNEAGKVIYEDVGNTDADGKLEMTWLISTNLFQGFYKARMTDNATNTEVNQYRLLLIKNIQVQEDTNQISIIAPKGNQGYYKGLPIEIQWVDKVLLKDIQNSGSTFAPITYNIEYAKDEGVYQLYSSKTITSSLLSSNYIHENFIPEASGVYYFRIYRASDTSIVDTSQGISVASTPLVGFNVERVWDNSAPKPLNQPILGVAADGTARFFFKIKKNDDNPRTIISVSLSLMDSSAANSPDYRLVGKIVSVNSDEYSLSYNDSINYETTNHSVGDDDAFWFCYIAPNDFSRDSTLDYFSSKRHLYAKIQVEYAYGPPDVVAEKIDIVRPPLMMVHGVAADKTTWENTAFSTSLNNELKYKDANEIFRLGVYINEMYKSKSFESNALLLLGETPRFDGGQIIENYQSNSFQNAIIESRKKGYACNRIDYICHSMGGVVMRTAINHFPEKYFPTSSSNALVKNYGKGFINKAITINSPHWGSPFADYAQAVIPNLNKVQLSIVSLGYLSSDMLSSFIRPDYGNNKYGITPAVADMCTTYGGIRFSETPVRNHMIAGKIDNANWDLDVLSFSADLLSPISRLLLGQDFIEYAHNIGYINFEHESDAVVPVSSQFSQASEISIPPNGTLMSGLDYLHMGVTSQLAVGNRIFELLNSEINSSLFAASIPANFKSGGIQYRQPLGSDSVIEHIDTNKIIIVSNFETAYIDSTYSVVVKIKDTTSLKEIFLSFQGQLVTSFLKDKIQVLSTKVNPDHIGIQKLLIGALYDSIGYDVYHYEERDIEVASDGTAQQLIVNPYYKMLNPTDNYHPAISIIHDNYITTLSSDNSDLSFQILDTNVVRYDSLSKSLVAKDSGSSIIIYDYQGLKDTFYLYITPRTNLDSMGQTLPIGLTNFRGNLENCQAELNWEMTSETNSQTYVIERSTDGRLFDKIGLVTENRQGTHYFKDKHVPMGDVFYRIAIHENGLQQKFSKVLHLLNHCSPLSNVNIFPNPANKQLSLSFVSNSTNLSAQLEILDIKGNTVIMDKFKTKGQSELYRYNISTLPSGTYLCRLNIDGVNEVNQKIVIIR